MWYGIVGYGTVCDAVSKDQSQLTWINIFTHQIFSPFLSSPQTIEYISKIFSRHFHQETQMY